jgi:hypothetical protein
VVCLSIRLVLPVGFDAMPHLLIAKSIGQPIAPAVFENDDPHFVGWLATFFQTRDITADRLTNRDLPTMPDHLADLGNLASPPCRVVVWSSP